MELWNKRGNSLLKHDIRGWDNPECYSSKLNINGKRARIIDGILKQIEKITLFSIQEELRRRKMLKN